MMQDVNRPGFMVYFDDLDAADELLNEEQLGIFIHAVASYVRDGVWIDEDSAPEIKAMLRIWKRKLDRDGEKYQKSVRHTIYMNYVKEEKQSGATQWLTEREWLALNYPNTCQNLSGACHVSASTYQALKGTVTRKEKEEKEETPEGNGCKGKGEQTTYSASFDPFEFNARFKAEREKKNKMPDCGNDYEPF